MKKIHISPSQAQSICDFLEESKQPELIPTYLLFVEEALNLHPALFARDKMVFKSAEDAVRLLEKEGKLWRETEIKIGYNPAAVDEETKKIYICPFTGKVFGDNTHPNPQDAIYDWVANCPENKERVGGVKSKRFMISEDPEVIKAYASKFKPKAPITKVVFSSVINNKLFNSKESVIEDFKQNYLKRISLAEVQGQSKFHIEESFMKLIEEQLTEDKIAAFVEALSEVGGFDSYIEKWLGDVE
jgi:hypothetical protein